MSSPLFSLSAFLWMLDVDGVLVSLLSKRAEEALIERLAHYLQRGDFLTFNTGRSPGAVVQLIISRLIPYLPDPTLLSRMMIAGEKGGAWAHYTQNGTLNIAYDASLRVPLLLKSAVSELIKSPEFAGLVEIEPGKRTMVSVIRKNHCSLGSFRLIQKRFAQVAQQCLEDLRLADEWKLDVVSDAIEIEPISASKGKGANCILHWLQCQHIWPYRVIAVEDSPSGVSMAEILHSMQLPVEFVFVGTTPLPRPFYPFPVHHTQHPYEQGLLEYLAQYHSDTLVSINMRG